ncbi:methyltransferase family protein [Halosolutus halophilus]|uniref:methyltransferase family protein n=1 Tax=Halosolutus halophilus TaxID=1552990 RepID=UPI0022350401|nr:isoprenylcysteine carboxylmethyltransferase family protein [Halosolutus halophilus]
MTGVETGSPVWIVFGAGLVSAGILLVGLGVSIAGSAYRFWPHGDRNWTFWIGWLCWSVYTGCLVGVAYLDAGSVFTPGRIAFGVGVVLVITGTLLSIVAALQLDLRTSSGLTTELYTDGVYRYSRNPQYVGFVVAIGGLIVCSGSLYAFLLGSLGVVWFLAAPLAEEPWLREQYGDEYDSYRERTPRFVGLPRRDLVP